MTERATVRFKLRRERESPRRGSAPAEGAPCPARKAAPPGPCRAARMLALAHHLERLVEEGKLRDYADAARRLGITRARVSQIADLLLLSPAIQEALLLGTARASERDLRRVVKELNWQKQNGASLDREDEVAHE